MICMQQLYGIRIDIQTITSRTYTTPKLTKYTVTLHMHGCCGRHIG